PHRAHFARLHLPASPTRRSSDLSCGLPDHDENQIIPHLHTVDIGSIGLPAVDAPVTILELRTKSVPLPAFLSVDGQPDRSDIDRDRKSTRLNSSHGSISYAVFCL